MGKRRRNRRRRRTAGIQRSDRQAEEPEFTVEKLQRIKGSDSSFTTDFLLGTAGQTVEYEIVVKNTGDVPLSLSPLRTPTARTSRLPARPKSTVDEQRDLHLRTHAGEGRRTLVQHSHRPERRSGRCSRTTWKRLRRKNRNSRSKRPSGRRHRDAVHGRRTDRQAGGHDRVPDRGLEHRRQVAAFLRRCRTPTATGVSPADETELEPDETEIFTCHHVLEARR